MSFKSFCLLIVNSLLNLLFAWWWCYGYWARLFLEFVVDQVLSRVRYLNFTVNDVGTEVSPLSDLSLEFNMDSLTRFLRCLILWQVDSQYLTVDLYISDCFATNCCSNSGCVAHEFQLSLEFVGDSEGSSVCRHYCVNGVGEFSFWRCQLLINLTINLLVEIWLRRWWCDMYGVRVFLWLMVDTVFSSVRNHDDVVVNVAREVSVWTNFGVEAQVKNFVCIVEGFFFSQGHSHFTSSVIFDNVVCAEVLTIQGRCCFAVKL